MIVGVGIGLMDGGVETDIPIEQVPEALRAPNSEFGVVIRADRSLEIVPKDVR